MLEELINTIKEKRDEEQNIYNTSHKMFQMLIAKGKIQAYEDVLKMLESLKLMENS